MIWWKSMCQNRYLLLALFVASLPFFQYYVVWNGSHVLINSLRQIKSQNQTNAVSQNFVLSLTTSQPYQNISRGDGFEQEICEQDFVDDDGKILCRPRCKRGYFSLKNMNYCHKWLNCTDLKRDVVIGKRIGGGNIKRLYLAKWKGHKLVLNRGNSAFLRSYFKPGVKSLISLQPSQHVTQFVGHCNNYLLAEYYPMGDLSRLETTITEDYPHLNTLQNRLNLCIDYGAVLTFLSDPRNISGGARVMCDTSTLNKLLHQYLLTDSFRIILNDVDSLPKIGDFSEKPTQIRCGKKAKFGIFSAPEQKWRPGVLYTKSRGMYYDEKVDVWKIPDVCNHFLGNIVGSVKLKRILKDLIHIRCKIVDPKRRPSAFEVYKAYISIYKKLFETNLEV